MLYTEERFRRFSGRRIWWLGGGGATKNCLHYGLRVAAPLPVMFMAYVLRRFRFEVLFDRLTVLLLFWGIVD